MLEKKARVCSIVIFSMLFHVLYVFVNSTMIYGVGQDRCYYFPDPQFKTEAALWWTNMGFLAMIVTVQCSVSDCTSVYSGMRIYSWGLLVFHFHVLMDHGK